MVGRKKGRAGGREERKKDGGKGEEKKGVKSGRGSHQAGSWIRGVCARPVGRPGAKAGVWKHLKPSRNGDVLGPPPWTVVCI